MASSEFVTIEPTKDECSYASLAHFLMLPTWWIGPLIVFAIKRDSKFVRFHAVQALVLQGLCLLCFFVFMVVWFGTFFLFLPQQSQGQTPAGPPPAIFFIAPFIWLVMMAGWIAVLTIAVVFGVRANRGEWAGYPVIGNWARRIAGV